MCQCYVIPEAVHLKLLAVLINIRLTQLYAYILKLRSSWSKVSLKFLSATQCSLIPQILMGMTK